MEYGYNQIQQLLNQINELQEELAIADEILESVFEDENFVLVEEEKKWIQKAIKKEGALHKSLKVKKGEKIPLVKLEKASHKGGKMGKRARLALTLRTLSHKKKELKESTDLIAQHAQLSNILKSEGHKMGEDQKKELLGHVASIEGALGKEKKIGYHPWLTVAGEY
jgi:hypothetical protein